MDTPLPETDVHLLRPILATVLDAVIACDQAGRIEDWNDTATQTFGWTREEAIGRKLEDLIVPPQHRAAHIEGMRRIARGAPARVLDRRIEITALTRSGAEIPIEMAITTVEGAERLLFVAFLRDISERVETAALLARRAAAAELTFDIAMMVSDAESFEAALEKTLKAILGITGWPVGHAFVRPNANPVLAPSGVWVELEHGSSAPLRAATDAHVFTVGVGLPGAILETGEPVWVEDTDAHPNFPRKELGFRSSFGFPLKSEGSVIAVLEFFSNTSTPPDQDLLRTVRTLGELLGRLFERKRTEDRQSMLVDELNHRVKNTLSVVQGIAQQTFRPETELETAKKAFASRLSAVSSANQLLMAESWAKASIKGIIEDAVRGCGGSLERFEISGRDFDVRSSTAVSIALAIHELCTNAYKYGALSNADGTVLIRWDVEMDAGPVFVFEWRESGGPPVAPPSREGFGSRILTRGLMHELGGKVTMDFASEGLVFGFRAPVAAPGTDAPLAGS